MIHPSPKTRLSWTGINSYMFSSCTGFILSEVRAPFLVLQKSTKLSKCDVRLRLVMYVAEIIHALRSSENQVVSPRKLRKYMITG